MHQEHMLDSGERYVISLLREWCGGVTAQITWIAESAQGTAYTGCQIPGVHHDREAASALAHEFARAQIAGGSALREINYRFNVRR